MNDLEPAGFLVESLMAIQGFKKISRFQAPNAIILLLHRLSASGEILRTKVRQSGQLTTKD